MDTLTLGNSQPKRPFSIWVKLTLALVIFLVMGGIIAGVVVVVRPAPTTAPVTPTVTLIPTITPPSTQQTLVLSDPLASGYQCLQFAKLQFPNTLEHAACGGSGTWTNYLDSKVVAYRDTDYEYCFVAASSLGSDVVGGNGGCRGVQVSSLNTITSNGFCITKINGLFQWGDCADALTFGVVVVGSE